MHNNFSVYLGSESDTGSSEIDDNDDHDTNHFKRNFLSSEEP